MPHPRGILLAVKAFQFAAKPLRQCRTITRGGDGDLQWPSIHHGWKVEVAVLRVVHSIAENAARICLGENSSIDGPLVRRADREKCFVQIGRAKLPPLPL